MSLNSYSIFFKNTSTKSAAQPLSKIDVNLFSWIQLSKESVPMER